MSGDEDVIEPDECQFLKMIAMLGSGTVLDSNKVFNYSRKFDEAVLREFFW